MSFRPTSLNEIIGQDQIKEALEISLDSARLRNDVLGHVLLDGPGGLGKTTFANAIATELRRPIKTILGSNIKNFKDILPTIMNLNYGDILFIDEIHRVNKRIAESLYTVMEDFALDIPVKDTKGNDAEVLHIDLPRFTLVGATTDAGILTEPLMMRFKLRFSLQLYDPEELAELLTVNATKLSVPIGWDGLCAIAEASRGTPRIANGLLEWVRDYGIAKSIQSLSARDAEAALRLRKIGLDGSTENDRLYLKFLKDNGGGPIGLDSICSGINVDKETVASTIEPWLIRNHIIRKTRGGRELV